MTSEDDTESNAPAASGATTLTIPDGQAAIVVGSLTAATQDRSIERAEVVPVQVLTSRGLQPVPYFRDVGELGLSSFAFAAAEKASELPVVFFTTGNDLHELDLKRRVSRPHTIDGLKDVHELTWDGRELLIANTGVDEIVRYAPASGHVEARVSLEPFRKRTGGGPLLASDRFHANQAFRGFDDDLWVLVHHVNGWQLLERMAERTVKLHGNGGVLNLTSGDAVPLGLFAPHTVRLIGDQYCLLDSGQSLGQTYDRDWNHLATFPTLGWGRGAAIDGTGTALFAGMSPIRRRYRLRTPASSVVTPTVQEFSPTDWSSSGALEIPDMEQINNVYMVTTEVADALLAFSP